MQHRNRFSRKLVRAWVVIGIGTALIYGGVAVGLVARPWGATDFDAEITMTVGLAVVAVGLALRVRAD